MNELSKKELIKWLDEKIDNYDEQAYRQIVALIKRTITEKDIEGWAYEARRRVEADRHWGCVIDTMKEMLDDIGVSLVVDK